MDPDEIQAQNSNAHFDSKALNSEVSKSNQNSDSIEDEENICRVCRTGSEPGRVLFYPCKCSGSIKYIHEDCLVTWLKHSKSKYCELCKTPYRFTPIYAPNTPKGIPLTDLVIAILNRLGRFFYAGLRMLAVIIVWIMIVPISTTWLWKFYLGSLRVTDAEDLAAIFTNLTIRQLATDCSFGFILASGILLLLLGLSSVIEYTQTRAEEQAIRRVNQNDVPDPANNDDANEEEEEEEDEDENEEDDQGMGFDRILNARLPNPDVELEEFIGYAGPITHLMEKCFLVITCFGAFLAAIILLPRILGFITLSLGKNFIDSFLFKDNAFINQTERSQATIDLIIGYISFFVLGFSWMIISYLIRSRRRRGDRHPLTQFIRFMFTFVKVVAIIVVEGGVFPLGAGYAIDYCTGDMFSFEKSSKSETEAFFSKFYILGLFIHWAIGLFYMFIFATTVSWLRETVRDGVLWFFRNPNDPNFDPLKDMIELPFYKHVRRIILSAILYGSMIVLLIWGPVKLCKYLAPNFFPFKLWSKDIQEVPIDIIVFHILLPITVDYIHPTQPAGLMKRFIKKWMELIGGMLHLNSYLLPPDEQDQDSEIYYPDNFKLRIAILITLGLSTVFMINFAIMVCPVYIGRYFTVPFLLSDSYAFAFGLYVIWGSGYIINIIWNQITSGDAYDIFKKAIDCVIIGMKWFILLFFWFIVIPLTIGLLFELILLIPVRTGFDQSPTFFLYHDWGIGLIQLQSWYRIITSEGMQSPWKAKFDRVLANGIRGVMLIQTMREIILPILKSILVIICVPYVIAKGIIPLLTSNVLIQNICFISIYYVLAIGYTGMMLGRYFAKWFPKFKQSIIDDRYLIGHRLNNMESDDAKSRLHQSSSDISTPLLLHQEPEIREQHEEVEQQPAEQEQSCLENQVTQTATIAPFYDSDDETF